jgi:hypothetical protein
MKKASNDNENPDEEKKEHLKGCRVVMKESPPRNVFGRHSPQDIQTD